MTTSDLVHRLAELSRQKFQQALDFKAERLWNPATGDTVCKADTVFQILNDGLNLIGGQQSVGALVLIVVSGGGVLPLGKSPNALMRNSQIHAHSPNPAHPNDRIF